MKSSDNTLSSFFEKGIIQSFKNYEKDFPENILSDLYIGYDEENTTLCFYDDMENLLHKESVEHLPEDPSSVFVPILKRFEAEDFFKQPYISHPFTVSLVDNNFVVTEELIFVDDDTLKLEGDLWTNIEKDLNDFLKQILQ